MLDVRYQTLASILKNNCQSFSKKVTVSSASRGCERFSVFLFTSRPIFQNKQFLHIMPFFFNFAVLFFLDPVV
jgi:hypothetical protein